MVKKYICFASFSLMLGTSLTAKAQVKNLRTNTVYATLEAAISNALNDDTLKLTQDLDIGANKINVNKKLVIDGDNHTITENKIWVNNSSHSFAFTKAGATFMNVKIKKTNYESTTSAAQFIIAAYANQFTFENVELEGVKAYGMITTKSRGFESTYNVKDLVINNCRFKTMGMVGYINPNSTGEIKNNTYTGTSGWNLHKNTEFQLLNNTWSESLNFINIIKDSPTDNDSLSNWYTCKIPQIIANNVNVENRIRDNEIPYPNCSPLPIHLAAFKAENWNNQYVTLTWNTLSELNNKGFYVERSKDAASWKALDFVNSLSDQGLNKKSLEYIYKDESAMNGLNYYRIRQVDFDGKITYSPIASAYFDKKTKVLLFPNPAINELNISGLPENNKIVVYDFMGRRVLEKMNSESSIILQVNHMPAGAYRVQVVNTKLNTQEWFSFIKKDN